MAKASKGSSFEREISTRLSEWWSDGERDDIFWRTSNSGGRATFRKKGGKSTKGQYGDLCAIDPIGQPFIDCFTCELKRGYNRSTIADLLDKPKGAKKQTWEEWIAKVTKCMEAADSKSWLIISKRDRRETMVAMPYKTYLDLLGSFVPPAHALIDVESYPPIVIFTFAWFLKNITPANIQKLLDA